MTLLSSERLEALFADALARPPEQWATYLATAVDDAEARLEVLSMLLAHQWKGRFDSLAEQLRGGQQAAASVHLENFKDRVNDALAGRYRLERELGRGGMATVWLAQDLKHDRPVAIKVLRPELAATLGSERFVREITVTARLHHPHVLALLDSGEAEGVLYYAMPFVEGESLRERLTREKQLPLEDALQITREVADALSYAHSHDVLHRDVKPENILLESAHAIVADFGIARAITAAGSAKLTETGIAVGTPAYMSPEQGAGRQDIDGRSDLYALGCVLYEMLAGHPPFTGTTAQEVLARHSLDAVPRLSAARSTIPPPIEAAVLKVLAKTPADRFGTARQFADALSDRAPAPRSHHSALRHRSVRVALGVALLGVFIWVATLAEKGRTNRRHLGPGQPDIVQLTFGGNARTPALSPDGQRLAYSTRECEAIGKCTVNIVVQDIEGAGQAVVARGLVEVMHIQWTSDGRYLVVHTQLPGTPSSRPYRVPSLGGAEPRFLGCCRGVIVGSTDTVLVMQDPGDSINWARWVTIADGVTHDSLRIRMPRGFTRVFVDPIADGKRLLEIAFSYTETRVVLLDRKGRAFDSLRLEAYGPVRSVQPSLDGKWLLVGTVSKAVPSPVDGSVVPLAFVRYPLGDDGRFSTRPDTIVRVLQTAPPALAMLSIAPTGTLTYASGATRYELWLLRRGGDSRLISARRRLAAATGYMDGKISPDGRLVGILRGVVHRDRQLKQFSIMSSDSGPEIPIGSPQDVAGWEWVPDGSKIVLAVREPGDSLMMEALELPAGTTRRVATLSAAETGAFAPLPEGGLAVVSSFTKLRRIGVPGLADSSLDIPENLIGIAALSPSPKGLSLALYEMKRQFDTLLVDRISLLDGHTDRLAAFQAESDPNGDPPVWLPDGSMIISLIRDQNVVWYRVPPSGGRLVRVGEAPWNSATYRWSADGRNILATVRNDMADVYAIRNFAELLNR